MDRQDLKLVEAQITGAVNDGIKLAFETALRIAKELSVQLKGKDLTAEQGLAAYAEALAYFMNKKIS